MSKKIALVDKYNQEGISYANQKAFDKAIISFKKALKFSNNPHSYYFLGLASQMSGRAEDAQKYYSSAIKANPNFSMAHNNLGVIYLDKKDFPNAISHLSLSISSDPNNAFAYVNLGNAYKSVGKIDEAKNNWNSAISLNPNIPEPYNNLGLIHHSQGEFDKALEFLKKSIEIDPNYPPPYFHLGVLLAKENQLELAHPYLEQYIRIVRGNAEAWALLGNIYLNLGLYDKALNGFKNALSMNPKYAHAINDLGNLYKQKGELVEALKYYQQALNLDPSLSGTYNNIGVISFEQGKFAAALVSLEKATQLDPECAEAYYHMGLIFERQNKLDLAAQNFLKALKIDPKLTEAQALLVYALMQSCDWGEYKKRAGELDRLTLEEIKVGEKSSETPFLSVIRKMDPQINLAVAQLKSNQIKKVVSKILPPFSFTGAKSKKIISIGYLSNDFYDHATSHLIFRLFELHDRKKFKVYAYSYGPNDKSTFRKKLENDADKFTDVFDLSFAQTAQKIYDDGVDILVDLKGYTKDSRMEIAALRPAPVQVVYLGFPGSTGASFFDYIITDKIVTPPQTAKYYSEKFAYLPNCYQINNDKREISNIKHKRSNFNLPDDAFIFSSFNHTYKIDPQTFNIWMRILKKVPNSILWLLKSNLFAVDNLQDEAKKRGVNPDRIIFSDLIPNNKHLARIQLSDLGLDTFICNGHTTTSDSLWAGVPVITLQGNHFASRVSSSILSAVGLPELITKTPKGYEDLAIKLAKSPQKLKSLKDKLAKNRLTKPLFNTKKFVSNLEEVYSKMWENYTNA